MAMLQKTGSAAGPSWAEKTFCPTTIINDATLPKPKEPEPKKLVPYSVPSFEEPK